jgi:hypothetical protein
MDYYPSAAAMRWGDRIASIVRHLPSALDDRAEREAAAILRCILDDRASTAEVQQVFQKFDLARKARPVFRQADFNALKERAAALEDEVFAMSDAYANAFGALARAGRLPGDVDSAGIASAFGEALDALYRLHGLMAGAAQSIIAAEGEDVGGPALSLPPIPAIDTLAQGLARIWLGAGRSIARDDGKLFVAILRVAHEALTGELDIKSEDRVLARVRAWAKSARTP